MPKTHKKAAQFLSANFTLDQGCVNLRAPKTTFDGLYSIVYLNIPTLHKLDKGVIIAV